MIRNLLLLLLLNLIFCSNSYALTEFVCTVNKTGQDYDLPTDWATAMDVSGNLDGTVYTIDWDSQTGSTVADNTAVDWDGGASTGTLVSMTATSFVIDVLTGSLADNDVILDVATSTDGFTVNGTPDYPIMVCEIYDDDGMMTETSSITCDTYTDHDTYGYWVLRAPVGERHDGTLRDGSGGTGVLIYKATDMLLQTNQRTHTQWLQLQVGSGDRVVGCLSYHYNFDSYIENCILDGSGVTLVGVTIGGKARISNTIIQNVTEGIVEAHSYSGGRYYNVSFYGMTNGIGGVIATGGTHQTLAQNCLVFGTGTCVIAGVGSTTNMTQDTTGGDATTRTASDYFTDLTGDYDLHLKTGASAIDAGTNLGTSSYNVELDIDNRDRDAEGDTWDIGADEFVAGGGPAPSTFVARIMIF